MEQVLNLQISVHTGWIQPSECVMFLTSSVGSWPLSVPLRGGLFWSWALSFISVWDCLICSIVFLVIVLGLWLCWRQSLSARTPVRKPKCMKSCPFSPTPILTEGSEEIKNKLGTLLVSGFLHMSLWVSQPPVQCAACSAPELERVWNDEVWDCVLCYDQSALSSKGQQQLMKPLTPFATWLPVT